MGKWIITNSMVSKEEDIKFLLWIFENHPEWELKEGVGISSISIQKNMYNRCFQLNRVDGSSTDISYTKCISSRSKLAQVKSACRYAISSHIIAFRNDNVVFGVTACPFTGEVLTRENTHIDHYDMTFEEMFKLWVGKYDIDFLFSKINETKDNCVITCFTDKSIVSDFIQFHNDNTQLRAVSKAANLSLLKYLK